MPVYMLMVVWWLPTWERDMIRRPSVMFTANLVVLMTSDTSGLSSALRRRCHGRLDGGTEGRKGADAHVGETCIAHLDVNEALGKGGRAGEEVDDYDETENKLKSQSLSLFGIESLKSLELSLSHGSMENTPIYIWPNGLQYLKASLLFQSHGLRMR
jgi:hypothetical protein